MAKGLISLHWLEIRKIVVTGGNMITWLTGLHWLRRPFCLSRAFSWCWQHCSRSADAQDRHLHRPDRTIRDRELGRSRARRDRERVGGKSSDGSTLSTWQEQTATRPHKKKHRHPWGRLWKYHRLMLLSPRSRRAKLVDQSQSLPNPLFKSWRNWVEMPPGIRSVPHPGAGAGEEGSATTWTGEKRRKTIGSSTLSSSEDATDAMDIQLQEGHEKGRQEEAGSFVFSEQDLISLEESIQCRRKLELRETWAKEESSRQLTLAEVEELRQRVLELRFNDYLRVM